MGEKTRVWPWALAVLAVAIEIYSNLVVASRLEIDALTTGELGWSVLLAVFAFSGALIVSRKPGNVIGWLLLAPGIMAPISGLATLWLLGFESAPTFTPTVWFALWLTSIGWVFLIFPVFHLMLTFPTGRLLTRRWRWVAGLEAVMIGGFLTLVGFSTEMELFIADETVWTVANPIGFVGPEFWEDQFGSVWGILLAILAVASVAGLIQRYRKSHAVERLQMKWLLLSVTSFGVVYALQALSNSSDGPRGIGDVLFAISLASIPISIAIAVLRYKLFEIDRLLSRTVSYALVVGLLAVLFFGMVSLLTTFLPDDQSDLTIAAATLSVFALFNPLRRRIQGGVDRRFNRSRYDSERVIDGFVDTLRSQLDSEQVVAGWVRVVDRTMQPSTVSVWLR